MIVVLTGATGFVGRTLAARLASEGHSLRALARDPGSARAKLPPGCALFPWSEGGPVPVEALTGADAIIHLAGENIAGGRWTAARKRRIRESRTGTARALKEAMARLNRGPTVFLSASGAGYYGDAGDRMLEEDAPPGSDFLAGVCRDWEAEALGAEALGARAAVLRLGLVLGPGGVLSKLAPVYRLGGGAVLGSGRQWWSWIHVEDAAGLFAHALADGSLRGPVNAAAGASTQRDFARDLGASLSRPVPLRAPAIALRLALGEMADSLLASQRVVPAKALASGYRFRYPGAGEAIRAALAPGAPVR